MVEKKATRKGRFFILCYLFVKKITIIRSLFYILTLKNSLNYLKNLYLFKFKILLTSVLDFIYTMHA